MNESEEKEKKETLKILKDVYYYINKKEHEEFLIVVKKHGIDYCYDLVKGDIRESLSVNTLMLLRKHIQSYFELIEKWDNKMYILNEELKSKTEMIKIKKLDEIKNKL